MNIDDDTLARLESAGKLRDAGVLTEEEFAQAKARILAAVTDGATTESRDDGVDAEAGATAPPPAGQSPVDAPAPAPEGLPAPTTETPSSATCAFSGCTSAPLLGMPWCVLHRGGAAPAPVVPRDRSTTGWIVAGVIGALIALLIVIGALSGASSSSSSSSASAGSSSSESDDESEDMRISRSDLESSIEEDGAFQLTGESMHVEDASCTPQDTEGHWWDCAIRTLGEPTPTPYTVEVTEDGEWAAQVDTDALMADAEAEINADAERLEQEIQAEIDAAAV